MAHEEQAPQCEQTLVAPARSWLLTAFVAVLFINTVSQISIGTHYGAPPPAPFFGSPLFVHLANYALLALSALLVLRVFGASSAYRSLGARWCMRAFSPYLAVWVLAVFLGTFPGVARDAWTAFLATLALLAAPASRDDRLRAGRWLARGVVGLSLLVAVTSPSWAFAPYDVWPGGWRPNLPRLEGIFPQPNPLGWFAAFAVIIELAQPLPLRRKLLPVLAALTCLVLSGSRTALFALVMAYVVALLVQRRLRISSRLVTWAVAALGIWGVIHVLRSTSTSGTDTLNGRQRTWDLALDAWHASPLIGTGPGAYIDHAATGEAVAYAHNQLLHTLAETGLLGAAALTWLTVSLMMMAWRMRVDAPYAAVAATTFWIALYGTENVLRFTSVAFVLPIAAYLLLLSAVDPGATTLVERPIPTSSLRSR